MNGHAVYTKVSPWTYIASKANKALPTWSMWLKCPPKRLKTVIDKRLIITVNTTIFSCWCSNDVLILLWSLIYTMVSNKGFLLAFFRQVLPRWPKGTWPWLIFGTKFTCLVFGYDWSCSLWSPEWVTFHLTSDSTHSGTLSLWKRQHTTSGVALSKKLLPLAYIPINSNTNAPLVFITRQNVSSCL